MNPKLIEGINLLTGFNIQRVSEENEHFVAFTEFAVTNLKPLQDLGWRSRDQWTWVFPLD